MKPTEDLIREHKAIRVMLGVMKQISYDINEGKSHDSDDLERIVDFLRIFADKCHHGKEEDALFPAMVAAGMPRDRGPIAVMLSEHVQGRKYIQDIETATKNHNSGQPAQPIAENLFNYVELLQGHILKEEGILFPMADNLLTPGTQEEVYSMFESIEEEVIGHGVHERYHELLERLKAKYEF